MSALERLKKLTTVVADTSDFEQMRVFGPEDATTNPTLLFQASQMPEYSHLLDDAEIWAKKSGNTGDPLVEDICDRLAVNFGREILKLVPGVVSTEVDANLSFDTQRSIQKARKLINLYEEAGVSRDRVLIKMAATWEGCEAARVLEQEGIRTNMTLLFSFYQAVAAADAGATLVSPFVGRILDWYRKNANKEYAAEDEPGVLSVQQIYKYYKKHGYKTIVMGASFRNIGEILALAGCDKVTVGIKLLEELSGCDANVQRHLDPTAVFSEEMDKIELPEASFRWYMNEDQMATEKLAEGIRNFYKDLQKLQAFVKSKLNSST